MSEQPADPSISSRTRKALSAPRRGVKLGSAGADNIRATVEKRRKADADAFGGLSIRRCSTR